MSNEQQKGGLIDFDLLGRILKLTAPYRKVYYTSIFFSIFLAVITAIRPFLVRVTIDDYITKFNMAGIKMMCIIIFGFILAEGLFRYIFNYMTAWLGQSIVRDMRVNVFSHIIKSRLKYFDTTPIGTSTTRTISDIEAVNDTFSEGLITIFADFATIIAVLFMMFVSHAGIHWYALPIGFSIPVPYLELLNWKLALISLCTLPLLLAVTRWFQQGVKRSFQDERTQIGRLNAFLQEHITGMRIIQIFNAEEKEMKKFTAINEELKAANIKGIWYYSFFFPAVEICLAIAIGAMVWYASKEIITGEIPNVGVISAFILYINMLFRPLRFIADKVNVIQRGLVASDRVFKLLDNDERIVDNGTYEAKTMAGKIEFEDVWFAYNEEDYVLKGVNFKLNAGETLAIVGATGSGKTSTISLLGRFYEINKGAIKIDDVNIRGYKLNALRSKMSIVLQDVFLFAGSVYENITLRNTDISREQVERAAKLVGAHDFIMRLPGGYDYKVMERGATLSMGQRQLISFVRALVYNPSILILDEATSSIDSESEELIQNAIEKLVKGRTSIVIAHRLSTIRHAHKIMVLDRGELKEFGTHEELLAMNGYYKNLYDMQFMKQEPVIN